MKPALVAALVSLSVAACFGPSATPVSDSDGRPAYALKCRHRIDCLQLAGETCENGYLILDASEDEEMSGAAGGGSAAFSKRNVHGMMIRCTHTKNQ